MMRFLGYLVDRARETMYLSSEHRNDGTAWSRVTNAHDVAMLRRTMNDVADGLLMDVREISIIDLEFADTDSALSRALERILVSKPDCNFNSFNNFIS
jgi:hypothetical protein